MPPPGVPGPQGQPGGAQARLQGAGLQDFARAEELGRGHDAQSVSGAVQASNCGIGVGFLLSGLTFCHCNRKFRRSASKEGDDDENGQAGAMVTNDEVEKDEEGKEKEKDTGGYFTFEILQSCSALIPLSNAEGASSPCSHETEVPAAVGKADSVADGGGGALIRQLMRQSSSSR